MVGAPRARHQAGAGGGVGLNCQSERRGIACPLQLGGGPMVSTFNVRRADGYEQLMGRWSKRLAPLFIAFAGLADGDRVLDVGCGTGSLTFALAQAANVTEIAAIDYSPVFV